MVKSKLEEELQPLDYDTKIRIELMVFGLGNKRWENMVQPDVEFIKKYYERVIKDEVYKTYFDFVFRIARHQKFFDESLFDINMGILKAMYPSKIDH